MVPEYIHSSELESMASIGKMKTCSSGEVKGCGLCLDLLFILTHSTHTSGKKRRNSKISRLREYLYSIEYSESHTQCDFIGNSEKNLK